MDKILEKVSLLKGGSQNFERSAGSNASLHATTIKENQNNANMSPPMSPTPSSHPRPGRREDRRDEALKLWKEWADESSVGQLPLEEEQKKAVELSVLERKCNNLARSAERRLAMSASLRGGSLRASGGGASTASAALLTGHGHSGQALGWAVKEVKREKAYAAVRLLGECERDNILLTGSPTPQIPKSRALLNDLINGRQAQPKTRPASASPYLNSRASSSQSTHRRHEPSANQQQSIVSSDSLAALRESNTLRNQLDEAHAAVESQTEIEKQLRETIDLLRARLHGQSQREVDHERRLQQHTKLEPLFDRLQENFSYSTPEQVIERLQLLEDDRLGTFGSLLSTQDEVTSLQNSLKEANQRADELRAQHETEHVKSSMQLTRQNEALKNELQAAETFNIRLQARQQQLVQLQTQVLHLWGKCQTDPLFLAANAPVGEGEPQARSGMVSIGDTNPLSAIALVEEYISAKSPSLAARHYVEVSRVANRVWSNHLKHKPQVRGKVVETFEQMSLLADVMARSIVRSRSDLEESKRNEKELRESLDSVLREKRKLEIELLNLKSKTREGRRASLLSSSENLLTLTPYQSKRNQRPQSALVSRIPSSPIAPSGLSASVARAASENPSYRPQVTPARPQSALPQSSRSRSNNPTPSVNLREHPPGAHWQNLAQQII